MQKIVGVFSEFLVVSSIHFDEKIAITGSVFSILLILFIYFWFGVGAS